jgi:hypothetical protein
MLSPKIPCLGRLPIALLSSIFIKNIPYIMLDHPGCFPYNPSTKMGTLDSSFTRNPMRCSLKSISDPVLKPVEKNGNPS